MAAVALALGVVVVFALVWCAARLWRAWWAAVRGRSAGMCALGMGDVASATYGVPRGGGTWRGGTGSGGGSGWIPWRPFHEIG